MAENSMTNAFLTLALPRKIATGTNRKYKANSVEIDQLMLADPWRYINSVPSI